MHDTTRAPQGVGRTRPGVPCGERGCLRRRTDCAPKLSRKLHFKKKLAPPAHSALRARPPFLPVPVAWDQRQHPPRRPHWSTPMPRPPTCLFLPQQRPSPLQTNRITKPVSWRTRTLWTHYAVLHQWRMPGLSPLSTQATKVLPPTAAKMSTSLSLAPGSRRVSRDQHQL